ncbi:hypothetical protein EXE59_10640 [Nocardioides eburneiflavus]|uniref:Uncharacterized protein n=1 Tax=Nocardioides eburneiflavus TaxID=2518372 RepID=A0A4Z1CJQ8_9ACTN|nr:hypothetical protein [Nocardioides eburneiflavus]TGN64363.1 hypothetical protein EXE59_10640 [Nocardioides eburneiflavus]
MTGPERGAGADADAEAETDRLKWLVEILAPTGVFVGLLYYFGYVTTAAWFRYFGLELGQVDLAQQAVVLQSIAALYLPVGALVVLGLGLLLVRRAEIAVLASGWRPVLVRRVGAAAILVGAVLLVRAVLGVVVPDISRTEILAASPLALCAGVLLVVGGLDAVRSAGRGAPVGTRSLPVRAAIVVLVVMGLFWATNSVAAAYGRGRAADFARTLPSRPAVVVDVPERLFLVRGAVEETKLADDALTYRYRYRNLRLLAASRGRLYFATADWRVGDGTVVVLPEDRVRLQFLR